MDDSSLTHILEDQREEFKTIREEFYRIARFKLVFAIVALAIFSIFITIGPGEIDGSAGKLAERLSNFYISLYILYLIVLASTTVIYYHKVLVSRSNFLNNAITCTNRIQETSNAIRNIHSQKYRSFETGMARMEDNSKTISDVREDLIKLYDEARVGVAAFGVTLLLLLFVALPNPSLILLGLLLTLGSFIGSVQISIFQAKLNDLSQSSAVRR